MALLSDVFKITYDESNDILMTKDEVDMRMYQHITIKNGSFCKEEIVSADLNFISFD